MKINCNVINDLLPLYKDNLLSEETHVIVQEHLNNCEQCNKRLKNYNKEISTIQKPPQKIFILFLIHIFLVGIIAIIVQFLGITYLNKKIFFTNYTQLQTFVLSLYFLMPLFSFITTIIIAKRSSKIKIFIYLVLLIAINQVLTNFFLYVFTSNIYTLSTVVDKYIANIGEYFFYTFVPIFIAFIFEIIYRFIKFKMVKMG